jgi:hypothetical protein
VLSINDLPARLFLHRKLRSTLSLIASIPWVPLSQIFAEARLPSMLLSSNHGNESASHRRAECLHHNQAAMDEYEDRGAHGRRCTSLDEEARSMELSECVCTAERPVQRSSHQDANRREQAASRPSALFDGLSDSLLPTPSDSGARDIEKWLNRIVPVSNPYTAYVHTWLLTCTPFHPSWFRDIFNPAAAARHPQSSFAASRQILTCRSTAGAAVPGAGAGRWFRRRGRGTNAQQPRQVRHEIAPEIAPDAVAPDVYSPSPRLPCLCSPCHIL